MNQRNPVIEGRGLEDMRRMALLREVERDHGRKKAAAILGVDRRTLDAGLDEGVLSRRMRGALDRALQSGVGSAAAEQRDRNDKLEARVEGLENEHHELGKELRRRLGVVERGVEDLRRDDAQGTGAGMTGPGPSHAETGASDGGIRPTSKPRTRREYPDLVTQEPAPDDEAVFGDAWPLIVEWRAIRQTHPNDGAGLEWLVVHERVLEVELVLLEQHGMTLPPEKQPLCGLDRSGQITWRRTALYAARRTIRKRGLLRWVRRVCTLGLWRK